MGRCVRAGRVLRCVRGVGLTLILALILALALVLALALTLTLTLILTCATGVAHSAAPGRAVSLAALGHLALVVVA